MLVLVNSIIIWMFVNGFGALGLGLQPERSESFACVIFRLPVPAVSA
jgi:hypothetical protein